MDGSDGTYRSPPPGYYYTLTPHGLSHQSQQQPRHHGRGPQPRGTGGFNQHDENEPLLGSHSHAGLESGLPPRSPQSNSRYWTPLFMLVILYIGYTLNPMINYVELTTHKAIIARMKIDEAVWEAKRASYEEQERQRYEDEVKKREGISWEGLSAARCSRYGTREYTASLAKVPPGFDAMEECRKKVVNINGRDLLPSRCEDPGVCGRVTGHWDVDFDEPGCITWWHWFDDKGCYSSGVRLYHSRLEHLEHYDLWPIMCATTPRVVNGVHYDGPTTCNDFGQGPWGVWHIPDASCS